jgi:hypothetical protein
MVNTIDLKKILMEWSVKSGEFYMSYILFSYLDTPIPNNLLYQLNYKRKFSSAKDFLKSHSHVGNKDRDLSCLVNKIKKSYYRSLPEYNNRYGYSIKKI